MAKVKKAPVKTKKVVKATKTLKPAIAVYIAKLDKKNSSKK